MIRTDSRQISMLNQNTVEIKYFDDITIELDQAKKDYIAYDSFTQDKKVKKLIISGNYTNITNNARKFIRQENTKRVHLIIAEAIVVHSLAQRLFGNFYFNLMKSRYPIKIFSSIEKAKIWLHNLE